LLSRRLLMIDLRRFPVLNLDRRGLLHKRSGSLFPEFAELDPDFGLAFPLDLASLGRPRFLRKHLEFGYS
jgi:hypothetical protein